MLKRAQEIPEFLTDTVIERLGSIGKEVVKSTVMSKVATKQLPKEADLISHGFGVKEDRNGDIWYAENGSIWKATTAEDEAVKRALKRG